MICITWNVRVSWPASAEQKWGRASKESRSNKYFVPSRRESILRMAERLDSEEKQCHPQSIIPTLTWVPNFLGLSKKARMGLTPFTYLLTFIQHMGNLNWWTALSIVNSFPREYESWDEINQPSVTQCQCLSSLLSHGKKTNHFLITMSI